MTDSRSELMALAERIDLHIERSFPEGHVFDLYPEHQQIVLNALRLAASQPQPDREMVARAATQAALTALRAGGDNLAIFNAVNESLSLLLVGGDQKKLNSDGQHQTEQSGKQLSPATDPELLALLERAKSHVMSPAERYEQRRSFVRGMCPSNRDYAEWCAQVDKIIPPMVAETRRTERGQCPPREVFADPNPAPPAGGR